MEFADYSGLGADIASDFHARHFARRDTHIYDSNHLAHVSHFNPAALAGLALDAKPRLTKEQHDILENEFLKQAKPNTNSKKRFAEVLGVSLDKVNVSCVGTTPLYTCLTKTIHRTGSRIAEQSQSRMRRSRPELSTSCKPHSNPTSHQT